MDKITIDIIEDNKTIRDNLVKFIDCQDKLIVSDVTSSIEEYFYAKKFKNKHSDILILDIGLQGISGIDGIPLIKEYSPNIEIIMLTNYEEEFMIVKALCLGACSYISKKSSLKDIVDAIQIVREGGSYMSPSIAREIVKHLMGGKVSKATILTIRQKEILTLLADGKSLKEIGKELFISIDTVKSHVKKLYNTLHVNNRSEAIVKYLKGDIK